MRRVILLFTTIAKWSALLLLAATLVRSVPTPKVFAACDPNNPNQAGCVCNFIQNSTDPTIQKSYNDCVNCFNSGGAYTALGCIGGGDTGGQGAPENISGPTGIIQSIMTIAIGAGGGIAFLLILFSGFQYIVSAGNPEKLHEARELMTAAISGLLLIIFSVTLLRLIGFNLFGNIPGFYVSDHVMHSQ